MAKVTDEDREKDVMIEWTETVHKTLTLNFVEMAQALKIKQSELKAWLEEGDEPDTDKLEAILPAHAEAEVYEEEFELLEISEA